MEDEEGKVIKQLSRLQWGSLSNNSDVGENSEISFEHANMRYLGDIHLEMGRRQTKVQM